MDVRKIQLRVGPVLGLFIDGDDILACTTQKSVNN